MAYVPLYFPGNSARRAVLIFLLFLEGTRWMLLLFAVIGVDALSPPVVSLDSMIWLACTVFWCVEGNTTASCLALGWGPGWLRSVKRVGHAGRWPGRRVSTTRTPQPEVFFCIFSAPRNLHHLSWLYLFSIFCSYPRAATHIDSMHGPWNSFVVLDKLLLCGGRSMETEMPTSSLPMSVKVNGWIVPPIVSIACSRMNCLLMVTQIGYCFDLTNGKM